ncbi:MAG: hypothetical protein D3M94_00530 [Rhodocyclales bacterium GT-UBC]|nr:MAG: hypothetical protein D3M94_00530 [Rhodocyclales bacterium GT-UBC]
MSISAIGSFYSNLSRPYATTARPATVATQGAASTTGSSSTVSISPEARQAAGAESGLRLPESVRQAVKADLERSFPEDIVSEAKARLQANEGIGGSSRTPGMGNLPLLPENQALLDKIRSDMQAARAADTESVFNLTPYARLMQAVQSEGWKAPMTMEDAQREVDIAQAMARLSPPPATAIDETAQAAAMADIEQQVAGRIPDKWRQRWQDEGLTMPTDVQVDFPASMWPKLADAAGISTQTFMTQARELAGQFAGNDYLRALESYISDAYSQTQGKRTTAA